MLFQKKSFQVDLGGFASENQMWDSTKEIKWQWQN